MMKVFLSQVLAEALADLLDILAAVESGNAEVAFACCTEA